MIILKYTFVLLLFVRWFSLFQMFSDLEINLGFIQ